MVDLFERRRAEMLRSIQRERLVHKMVEDLVLCGVRPKVIYQVLAKQISNGDIRRIHDCISPLPPSARHGRNIAATAVAQLSSNTHTLYLECFALVKRGIAGGAAKADCLAAAWRILTSRRGLPPHANIEGATCEEMIVLYLNYEIGELEVSSCGHCREQSLFFGVFRCVKCESPQRRRKYAA